MLLGGHPFEWTTSTKRVAFVAALFSGATGIFLAIFQVQGWKVPKPLALALIALLLLVMAGALLVFLVDFVQNVRAFLKQRATNVPWVSSEPPGFLDYEADGLRAQNRMNEAFVGLARDTGTVGKKLARAGKSSSRMQRKSAFAKQRWANRTARSINRSAVYIEERLVMLEKLVNEVERSYGGRIANARLETEQDFELAQAWRDGLDGNRAMSAEAANGVVAYRESVETFEAQNVSRSLRGASDRLGKALRGVERALQSFEKVAAGLVRDLDQKLAQTKRP